MKKLFVNGVIHPGTSEDAVCAAMLVEDGVIKEMFASAPEGAALRAETVDLGGKHIYPCLIDGHIHMLMTVAVMAMGFNACEITANGIEPDSLAGIEKRLRAYAAKQKKGAIVACNNYIVTGIKERRMPSRHELDEWCGGRPVVIYNIDGHSTALSTKMMELVGISPEDHSGVLRGEENERAQGRILDKVSSMITLPMLAKGIAAFQNTCAAYGIGMVGALEGSGDSPKDTTTKLIASFAQHMEPEVRLYLQYTDLDRVEPFRSKMKRPRVGGCGDWEMDGSVGSHSAAFSVPYKDTGEVSECYYSQEFVDKLVKDAAARGYQISSHAIGSDAITRLVHALDQVPDSDRFHRIEHCEFIEGDTLANVCRGRYAVMMQPGYAWIDKRYLHTYEEHLPEEIIAGMKLKTMYDAGVCVCGSSDSPVQDIDPYLQMLGMVQFYNEAESLTPYQAFRCYTANASRALEESDVRGTLEPGKVADFFTADTDFFALKPEEVVSFRPISTWYGGEMYREKKGTVGELVKMMLSRKKLI